VRDTLDLLDRRIIAYPPETLYAEKTFEHGNNGPADDLMKAFVRENLTADAVDTERDASAYFEVDGDASLGATVEKSASYRSLLATVKELADASAEAGAPLYFDVAPGNKFLFTVTTQGGLRNLTFGPAYHNLDDASISVIYDEEVTVVYVGGDGEGAGRLVETVLGRVGRSAFGRKEIFHEANDIDVSSVLIEEGTARLVRPKIVIEGRTIDTPQVQFGRDYFYGERVQASVHGYTVDCHIDAFSIDYSNGSENLDVRLRGELSL
jgi:hypothetical protein